jgi:hypothetical protein
MHRESIFACAYGTGDDELVAHVRAWDDREAAELFVREMELESDPRAIRLAEVRVRPVSGADVGGDAAVAASAAF